MISRGLRLPDRVFVFHLSMDYLCHKYFGSICYTLPTHRRILLKMDWFGTLFQPYFEKICIWKRSISKNNKIPWLLVFRHNKLMWKIWTHGRTFWIPSVITIEMKGKPLPQPLQAVWDKNELYQHWTR